jgi:hypothetical protein
MRVDVDVRVFGAVIVGRNLHIAPEDPTKIIGIAIAACMRDLLDGHVRIE